MAGNARCKPGKGCKQFTKEQMEETERQMRNKYPDLEWGAESFSADERKFVELLVEYNLPGDPEYINDLLTDANMKIIEMNYYWRDYDAESFSAEGKCNECEGLRKSLAHYYLVAAHYDDERHFCKENCPVCYDIEMDAEYYGADTQTRVYRNLGIGAALVAGLAYWFKR